MEQLVSQNFLANLFSNTIQTKNVNLGRALHSHLIKTALILDVFLANRLITLYSKSNSIDCAQKTFDAIRFKNAHSWNTMIAEYCQLGRFQKARDLLAEMPEPNLVSYNSMISSLCRSGLHGEAINVFRAMNRSNRGDVLIDEFTVVGLANACKSLKLLMLLRQVHGIAIVLGLHFNVIVCNALIDAYGKCGCPDTCYWIFSRIGEKDVVSWNSMLVAYATPSKLEEACQMFDQMPVRNVVCWTALIAGLVQNGEGQKALSLFARMQDEGVTANDVTHVSALSACADLALIRTGSQIHCHLIRNIRRSSTLFDNVFVVNALVDMYSKCGDMISSMRLFQRLHCKDIVSWNSIIVGFAHNGDAEASFAIFGKMLEENIRPNEVTFLGLLSACSHAGLESQGLQLLDMMEHRFSLIPRSDHYGILVDLLGRRNRLEEALEVIEKAPCGSYHKGMWGALLSSCHVHGNLEMAKRAAEALFDLEPENTGRYVTLSNIYKTTGKWEDANHIRRLIKDMDLEKEAGYSLVELRNARSCFVADDTSPCELEVKCIDPLWSRWITRQRTVIRAGKGPGFQCYQITHISFSTGTLRASQVINQGPPKKDEAITRCSYYEYKINTYHVETTSESFGLDASTHKDRMKIECLNSQG